MVDNEGKNLDEFKEKVYSELTDIKTDIKLLIQSNKSLSEAVVELKELNKNMGIVMTKQQSQELLIQTLFNKHENLQEEVYTVKTNCPVHQQGLKNIIKLTEEYKKACDDDIENVNNKISKEFEKRDKLIVSVIMLIIAGLLSKFFNLW
jgi:RNA processing factor Prp31